MDRIAGWTPSTVVLWDGTEVLSDSEEWRAQCEAIHYLRDRFLGGMHSLDRIGKKRGADARLALQRLMRLVEPTFVLDNLQRREDRRRYLDMVKNTDGAVYAERLYEKVINLHRQRAQVAAP